LLWVFAKVSIPISRWTPIQNPKVKQYLQVNKQKSGLAPVFISWILLGFLPCGLTYTMHMKAAATGDPILGGFTLLLFGLSTLPALAFIGLFSHVMSKMARNKVLLLGNIIAIVIGILSILRGMALNGWIPSVNPWLW
jgi:sulfite exporter TauE/SafE